MFLIKTGLTKKCKSKYFHYTLEVISENLLENGWRFPKSRSSFALIQYSLSFILFEFHPLWDMQMFQTRNFWTFFELRDLQIRTDIFSRNDLHLPETIEQKESDFIK